MGLGMVEKSYADEVILYQKIEERLLTMKRPVAILMKNGPEATDALFAPLNYLILKQRNRLIDL